MSDAAAGKSRRALLLNVAAVSAAAPLLAACDLLGPDGPPPPDPLTEFYAETVALVALYDAAANADPKVVPIRDAHRAHAAALAAVMKPAPPSNTPAATASPTDGAGLRAAEQRGYQKAVEVCLAAPANRATLIGEIAAARACHLELLP